MREREVVSPFHEREEEQEKLVIRQPNTDALIENYLKHS